MQRRLGLFMLVSLLATTAIAQTRIEALDRHFTALASRRDFNGNVLAAEDGKIIYEKSFGYSDFPGRIPNVHETRFPFASVSKTITATAVLQLYEKGELRLDDPVVQHLPGFPYPTITIRHLLSHTSGLPPYNAFFDSEWAKAPDRIFTNSDFIAGVLANPKPLLYEPGEKSNYDNVNFLVLALLVEKLSGMSYPDYVWRFVLEPAGMTDTSFMASGQLFDPAKKKDRRFAVPHLYPHMYTDQPVRADTIPYVSRYWRAYGFAGFGDYAGTARDLLKFEQALDNGKLLSRPVMEESFKPFKMKKGEDHPLLYGLGWMREKDSSLGAIVYHGGNSIGLSCVLMRNLDKRQVVIVFDVAHDTARPVALDALKILNGGTVPLPRVNLVRIYGKALAESGAAAAKRVFEASKAKTDQYAWSEDELNSLGYDFMGNSNPFRLPEEHRYAEALEVFQLNVRLFPASWNVYDSCAEALLKLGRREEAARMYRKSIELNPNNENGKKALEKLKTGQGF
jgi:CubicO group peptidase (beta-lactamase class C family)